MRDDDRVEGPSVRARALIALAIGAGAAGFALVVWHARPHAVGDIDQVLFAGRAMVRGQDPYALVGPGRTFEWPWPLYYPLTAAVALLPLAWLPVVVARTLFVGISAALLAFAVSREGRTRMPMFGSAPFLLATVAAQWSPLLTAAFAVPGLAWIFVAKPNLGAAYAVRLPGRRGTVVALVGGGVVLALSLALAPRWPLVWLAVVRHAPGFTAPIAHRGGVLLTLALLRWRRPEARLLFGMACVPHNMVMYEALPLFLIPDTYRQSTLLALLSSLAAAFTAVFVSPHPTSAVENNYQGDVIVALLYLPCLLLVLRRPNEGTVAAWVERRIQHRRAWGARAPQGSIHPEAP